LEKDVGSSKPVFGFRFLLGNPKSGFENRNPDFPIESTLNIGITPGSQYQTGENGYPIEGLRTSKTIPYSAAHTYITYTWESSPGGGGGGFTPP